jgi:hypothetical protein
MAKIANKHAGRLQDEKQSISSLPLKEGEPQPHKQGATALGIVEAK